MDLLQLRQPNLQSTTQPQPLLTAAPIPIIEVAADGISFTAMLLQHTGAADFDIQPDIIQKLHQEANEPDFIVDPTSSVSRRRRLSRISRDALEMEKERIVMTWCN